MNVLVTGADGFIGKNLVVQLKERTDIKLHEYLRNDPEKNLISAARTADVVIHLAGTNRPSDVSEYHQINGLFTKHLCDLLRSENSQAKLILASSTQAENNNEYGSSKLEAEEYVSAYAETVNSTAFIYRLPNVFGKWCKPNYNSVVATYCHNISQGLPIQINDTETQLNLVYIDDVVSDFIDAMGNDEKGTIYRQIKPQYSILLGELAKQINDFKISRESLVTDRVGDGLVRALYSTYISYLQPAQFGYELVAREDDRGVFVEMLKTPDCGQISYFTAKPGVTRGGHYHHSKTEKFLVISGHAHFGFRHILTNEKFAIKVKGDKPQIIETIPGWAHDITNIGDDELIVALWANEMFDKENPDTIASKV